MIQIADHPKLVDHQVMQIRGTLSHESSLILKTKDSVENCISVFVSNFKILCRLKPGENLLEIICAKGCCCAETTVFFERKNSKKYVKLLYICCSDSFVDGNSAEILKSRISLAAEIVQTFFGLEMWTNFGEPKTFQLETDEQNQGRSQDFRGNKPVCHEFRMKISTKYADSMDEKDFFWNLAGEILKSPIYDENCKFLAILSFTRFDSESKKLVGSVNVGKGQLAVVHGGCLFSWPESLSCVINAFSNDKILEQTLYDDSAGRGNYGGCFARSLGAIAHELGHVFDLIHDSKGVMGKGFENIQSVFLADDSKNLAKNVSNGSVDLCKFDLASAIVLYHHPWLNDEGKAMRDDSAEGNAPYITSDMSNVVSPNGMLLVELRSFDNDKRLSFWDLRQYQPRIWAVPYSIQVELVAKLRKKLGILTIGGCFYSLEV